ncbi:hypothetical protein TNCV_3869541 [Trichonephila clavipes]|nr:hypothetical protein TNCV_3869541 [Trichonephila clavipes]
MEWCDSLKSGYPAEVSSSLLDHDSNACGSSALNPHVANARLAFYLAIGSTLVTFLCSVLSVQAEVSTSTDKVQDEILEGKTLICLM